MFKDISDLQPVVINFVAQYFDCTPLGHLQVSQQGLRMFSAPPYIAC